MQQILKSVLVVVIGIMILVTIVGIYKFNFTNSDVLPVENATSTTPIVSEIPIDVKNISYVIDGQTFTLVNGKAEKEIAPGSATKQTVYMFGEPVYGDLNGDGVKDAAVMLVSSSGGSGTFYYAVLAMATGTTYKSTNVLILGDRIAPQTVEIRDSHALYNYVVRKANEAMTVQPSMGKSLWIHYDKATGQIGELVKNFEGEADVNRMTLDMKKWNWVKTQMNDGKVVTPKVEGRFTLTFTKDGKVSVGTDCNSMGGTYTVKGKSLTFNQMMSTMMYCEGSQEGEFSKSLGEIASYMFTSKGELILEMKMDSGVMVFR